MELYASAFDLVMVCLGHVVVWTKYMSIYGAYKRMKANTHCCPHCKDRGRESNLSRGSSGCHSSSQQLLFPLLGHLTFGI